MAISNLLTPNPKLPNIISSFSPSAPKKGLVPSFPAGPQSMIPTSKPVVSTAQQNKDYANFTDADWLQYQANKPKPEVQKAVVQKPAVQNNTVANNSMGTANQNAPVSMVNPNLSFTTTPAPQSKGLFADVTSSLASRANYRDPAYEAGLAKYNRLSEDIANIGMQGAKAQAGYQTTGTTPVAEGNAGVIARNTAAQQGALGVQQQAALTSAGLGQAQQGLQQSALSSAAGLASPRSADLLVDPTTGQPIGDINKMGSALANWSSIRSGAQTAGQFTADYQTGLANLRAADTVGQQIKNTISSNPTINNQPLAAWTNIKQLISGQFSDPAQQLLAQQVNQYIQTLGLDENTVMNIASQQQGTLGQLLDSLREQAAAQVESKNPQNVINNPQGTNPVQAGGGQIINTAVGPIDNGWWGQS